MPSNRRRECCDLRRWINLQVSSTSIVHTIQTVSSLLNWRWHSRQESMCAPRSKLTPMLTLLKQAITWALNNLTKMIWFHSLPFQQFQALFNSLFKVLFIFPSWYLFTIGLEPIFSLRWNLPPPLRSSLKERDSLNIRRARRTADVVRDSHPLWCSFPKGLHRLLRWHYVFRLQFKTRGLNFHVELFPVHSPLLKESCLVSFPPLTYMLKFSGSSDLTSCLWYLNTFAISNARVRLTQQVCQKNTRRTKLSNIMIHQIPNIPDAICSSHQSC